jgi:UPF0288 family protein (methanogenesis marker protein 3)
MLIESVEHVLQLMENGEIGPGVNYNTMIKDMELRNDHVFDFNSGVSC